MLDVATKEKVLNLASPNPYLPTIWSSLVKGVTGLPDTKHPPIQQ